MRKLRNLVPWTNQNVIENFDYLFAPWIKSMGLTELKLGVGRASAILPQNQELQWANGAICGQAIMAAVDTVASMAVSTTEREGKGTASQNTYFLRPALDEDLRIEANVLKFGSVIVYVEARVTFKSSGKLVAHSTLEFVF